MFWNIYFFTNCSLISGFLFTLYYHIKDNRSMIGHIFCSGWHILFRFDWRLFFVNLKNDERHKNINGREEREKIWIPNLVFDNSVEDFQISNDAFSALMINQTGNATASLNSQLQEDEKYQGIDNNLIYSRCFKMKLLCNFEQHFYPFDSQTCSIKVIFVIYKHHFVYCVLK